MKKKLIGMLCGAAVVSMAIPALAEVTVNGYFRTQGIVQNTTDNDVANDSLVVNNKDNDAESFVVQRFRAKVTNKLNDLVSVVWFGEVDTDWGTAGGAVGADGINVETKNVYADLKPSKDFPLSFRVGVQTVTDNIQGVYLYQDVAALLATGTFGNVNVAAAWSKFTENTLAGEDDTDLYLVQASLKATDTVKVGVDAYYSRNDESDLGSAEDGVDQYTIAPNFAASVAGINLDGFLAYQFGTDKNTDPDEDVDIAALAASVNASMQIANNMSAGLRVIYYGNDNKDDKDASFNGNIGSYAYLSEGLNIFLSDIFKTNSANDQAALIFVNEGYGLLGAVAKFKADFAPAYFKASLGYFQTLKDTANDDPDNTEIEGKALGTEIALEVGTKVAEIATLSLRGSYALLGSAYNETTADGEDPDNAYMVALMLNIPY